MDDSDADGGSGNADGDVDADAEADGRADLVAAARDAATRAFVPYSEYAVGAAFETPDGGVYRGCNVEFANYTNTLHAEEVALARGVVDGHTEFARLAVSSAARDGVTPCGMCRQSLAEFCGPEFPVLCDEGDGVAEYALGELLPNAITRGMVEDAG